MKLGVVMDPIETINFKKDSTLAMMIEAQRKEHEIFYMTPESLFIDSGMAFARTSKVQVRNDPSDWFSLDKEQLINLSELDVILMRQDPSIQFILYLQYICSRNCFSSKEQRS